MKEWKNDEMKEWLNDFITAWLNAKINKLLTSWTSMWSLNPFFVLRTSPHRSHTIPLQ